MTRLSKNYDYDVILTVKCFNTANFAFVLEKLREVMDDNTYIHNNSKMEIIPRENE